MNLRELLRRMLGFLPPGEARGGPPGEGEHPRGEERERSELVAALAQADREATAIVEAARREADGVIAAAREQAARVLVDSEREAELRCRRVLDAARAQATRVEAEEARRTAAAVALVEKRAARARQRQADALAACVLGEAER